MSAPDVPVDVVADVLAGTRADPAAPAIRSGRHRLRHGELHRRAAVLAARLPAEGLRPGDVVLFSIRPGPQAVLSALALLQAGAVIVFADPGAGPEPFAARAALARPAWAAAESALFALAGLAPLRATARRRGLLLPDYGRLGLRTLRAGPWLPGVPRGTGSLRAWSRGPVPSNPVPSNPVPSNPVPAGDRPLDDPALVVFTSGTTGDPRAVVHTRRSLGAALAAARQAIPMAPGDLVLTDQLMIGLAAIAAGACWEVPRIGAHPDDLLRRIRARRPSHVFTTPVVWHQVLLRAGSGAPQLPGELRYLLTGGAPAPAALLTRLADAAPGGRVLALYGGTELLPAAVVEARRKASYSGDGDLVGRLLPGVRARIAEGTGEVLLSAPQLCAGYLRPDGVAPLAEFATGDAGRLEPGPDGQPELVLAGRLKDMIIRGSTNIYPGLFEPGVRAVPGVAECALVGLPDPDTADERVVLAVVVEPGHDPAAVLAAVRAAVPRVFDADARPDQVVARSALPRSGRAGKLDRGALVRSLQTGR